MRGKGQASTRGGSSPHPNQMGWMAGPGHSSHTGAAVWEGDGEWLPVRLRPSLPGHWRDVLLMASAAGTPPCREPRSRLLAGARALLLEAPPEGHFHPGRCGGLREDTQE